MALASTVQESLWLKQFGADFDTDVKDGTINIFCDNMSTINLAESDGYRTRSKHIDIRHHFLRYKVANSTVRVTHVPTERMAADNLKAVTTEKHRFCVNAMGLK